MCLKYIGGDQFGHVNMVMVRSLEPQEISDVSVQMHSPANPGMYQGQWRMCTATGLFYGGEAPHAEDARSSCSVFHLHRNAVIITSSVGNPIC